VFVGHIRRRLHVKEVCHPYYWVNSFLTNNTDDEEYRSQPPSVSVHGKNMLILDGSQRELRFASREFVTVVMKPSKTQ